MLAIMTLGMGVAFFVTDPRAPTSRALAALFGILAVIVFLNVPVYRDPGLLERHLAALQRAFGALEALAFATAYEWLLRIRRTEMGRAARGRRGESLLRVAQVLAAFHGLATVAAPEWRAEFWAHVAHGDALHLLAARPQVLVVMLPIYVSIGLAAVSVTELARSKPDSAEVVRLNALGLAGPFLCSGLFVPGTWMPITTGIGLAIFLVGAIRYHVLQGERGQFLSRFLSPQVAALVRERGLLRALEKTRLEISVVACDLRGFTAYAESAPSEDVVALLERYYAVVGDAAATHGGTIKDHAGDGILVLVGAPIALPDTAGRAVAMARQILHGTAELLAGRWHDLGIGVGVATGPATVGAIAGATRLEYVAVGTTVNLAARLADRAESGQVLVDARTAELDAREHFERLPDAQLKGFAARVPVFAGARPADPGTRR